MARTGRVEGGGRQARSVADSGSETGGVGAGEAGMHRRCLARPCSARPPAFAGVIVVRGGFPLRVRGCLRADSGRRAGPGRRGRGAGSGAAPLGGVREGELLGASRCSTRLPDLLGATGEGGLLGDVWCSTRWRCRVALLGATASRTSLLGARGVRLGGAPGQLVPVQPVRVRQEGEGEPPLPPRVMGHRPRGRGASVDRGACGPGY